VVAAGLIAAPLVSVLVTALAPGGGSWLHLGRTVLPDLLMNSVLLAVLVGVLAATMGAVSDLETDSTAAAYSSAPCLRLFLIVFLSLSLCTRASSSTPYNFIF
jgi:ABC-type Fe3+ transport system permease subunit